MAEEYYGWDIGGVHLKLSVLSAGGQRSPAIRTHVVPFEIWKDPRALAGRLRLMLQEAGGPDEGHAAAHGVTMTGELADVFPSRADGVRAILAACGESLGGATLRVLTLGGSLVTRAQAMADPEEIGAANWVATARLVGRRLPDGLLIDVGSTTTDIIPIRNGSPSPAGRLDTDRLLSGELLYAGLLRTPPSSLCESVPLRGGWCRVAVEHFATTADVYTVLGRIGAADYSVATADGRGRSREECAARLARIVCSDPETLGAPALEGIASYVESRQIARMVDAISQVRSRPALSPLSKAAVAGVGAFLAVRAAQEARLESVLLPDLLPEIRGASWERAAPSAAIALRLAEEAGRLRLGPPFTR
jgi:(4-(4-[2-(gamma-L-glutamylamino)ethyl]phenoxymethyl)furan-2-yl)methanamine synthase